MMQTISWDVWIHESNVLNLNHKYRHWSEKAKRVEACKGMGIVKSMSLDRYKSARLDAVVYYPKAYQADVNNYTPTMKAYLDGLVNIPPTVKGQPKQPARGILVDDNDAYFRGPYLHPAPDSEKSGKPGWFRFHITLSVE